MLGSKVEERMMTSADADGDADTDVGSDGEMQSWAAAPLLGKKGDEFSPFMYLPNEVGKQPCLKRRCRAVA